MNILTPLEPTPPAPSLSAVPHTPNPPPPARPANPIAGQVFLPDGTPLLMSISRKVVLGALFDADELDENGNPTGNVKPWAGPSNPMEDIVVLFICATTPDVWYQPTLCPDGSVRHLYQNPVAFMAAAMEWADSSCLKNLTLGELYPIVRELWTGAHANFVTPLAEKKTDSPGPTEESPLTGPNNTPPSSPEETPADSPS